MTRKLALGIVSSKLAEAKMFISAPPGFGGGLVYEVGKNLGSEIE